ncbi:MAG: hypothetical protein RL732_1031 [Bacteroidota bacterium]
MIKFLSAFFLNIVLAFAVGLYMPWWSIALTSFIISVAIPQAPYKAFLSGFLSLVVLWGGLAFFIDRANQHLLLNRVAALFKLGEASYVLILLTALIGGILAGLAALSGAYIRKSGQ